MKTHLLSATAAIFFSLSAEAAIPSAPSAKPTLNYVSQVVSTRDANRFHRAMQAVDNRDWRLAKQLMGEMTDQAAADLILWRMASRGGTSVGFDTLHQALRELENWPDYARIRRSAETAISTSALSAQQRIDWFIASPAQYGVGKIALAKAYRTVGNRARATELVRDAWRNHALPRDEARTLLAQYGEALTQDDHRTRVDLLLWIGHYSAARDIRGELTTDYRALLDARYALARRQRGVDGKVAAVPAHLRESAGLLYERARWRRRARVKGVSDLLVQIDGLDVPAPARDILWRERNIALRTALKESDFATAYGLSAPHGMSRGAAFADAEWSAGWVALRFQGQPEKALAHFKTLRAGVSRPISVARADYWRGRTLSEMGDERAALEAYRAAATHKFTYYGQLAAERVGETDIYFTPTPPPTPEDKDTFENRSLVKAIRLLGEMGESALFRQFSFHFDDQLTSPVEHLLLAQIAADYHRPDVGVRGGKEGLAHGIVAPDAAYPVFSYDLQTKPRIENAFVLALSRQESELNPRAISHANARGLMQLLPRTAREQARREGLPYRVSWLTDDPAYNVSLGAAFLDDLIDRFNGSYIMAAAAYNAGPSRPAKWVRDYGDPRLGEVDPIDWVEFIPFSETRNYVQRILENVQVYRHRLTGEPQRIRLSEDLNRGSTR